MSADPLTLYDVAIVGAGPAGLSAALTARARGQRVLMISNSALDSALAKSNRIDNYPGLPNVSGPQLLSAMTEQVLAAGADLVSERVISILPFGQAFLLSTGPENWQARSIILALGSQVSSPLPGELEYLGRGVSYCATCDGMLFRGRQVVVFGLTTDAAAEANLLAEMGCEVSYVAPRLAAELDASIPAYRGRLTAIQGDGSTVRAVSYRPAGPAGPAAPPDPATTFSSTASNVPSEVDSTEVQLDCQGVFLLRPTIAPDTLIAGLELSDGVIVTRSDLSTSVAGVFAAGDCLGAPLQIAKAVGQGQLAALSAQAWLMASVL
ncbi:MAG: FAD-dependent oxidoreductase [Actinomycetia bacterium]|nr:FAD-dependent oxidoreductase [Actinomycetes bacterium]